MMRTSGLAKKLLVSALSLSLALGPIPTSALAEEAEGIDEIAELAEEGQDDDVFVEDGSWPAASQDDAEQGVPADGQEEFADQAPDIVDEEPTYDIEGAEGGEVTYDIEGTENAGYPDDGEASELAEIDVPGDGMVAQATKRNGTSGTCTWSIDEKGALVVKPTNGKSGELDVSYTSPWQNYRGDIVSVRFEGKVSIKSANSLFSACNNLESVDLRGLDTSLVEDFTRMFENCYKLEEVDLSSLDFSKAKSLRNFLYGCSSLKRVKLTGLKTSSVTDTAFMFGGCTSLEEIDLSGISNKNDQFSHLMFGSGGSTSAIKTITTDGTFDLAKAFPNGVPEGVTVVDTSKPALVDISSATVTAPAQTYTGSALKPAVTVKLGGTTLKQGTDFSVAYANNVNAGTATVTVTGKGNYTGTAKGTFTITKPEPQKVDLSSATIGGVSGWTYDGKTHTVTPTVTLSGKKLTAGVDYTVSGTTSTRAAGTYTLTITGAGGYTGTASKSFTVARKAVTVKADNKTKVQGDADPTLTAMVSGLVGSDKVTYSVSRAAGETPGTYTITPSGKATQGNYQVTYTKGTLTITEKPSEQPFEGTVLEELRHDVEVARAAYDAAVSSAGNVDVAGAQAEVDQVQAAYDKAYTEQQAAQAADATAQAELASAKSAQQSAKSEKAAADKAKSAATTELSKATSAYDAAKADADTVAKDKPALEAIAKAQSSYDAAVAKQKDAQSAYDKAQAASKAADAKVTEAKTATQDAKSKMDAAAKALADAQAVASGGWDLNKYNTARGSLGFFEYIGATSAAATLTGRKYVYGYFKPYVGYVTADTPGARTVYRNEADDGTVDGMTISDFVSLGAEGDATSLENMRAAIEWIRVSNEYRARWNEYKGHQPGDADYAEPLTINDIAMATSQLAADYVAHSGREGHSGIYAEGALENAAWGNGNENPFVGWYDAELAFGNREDKTMTSIIYKGWIADTTGHLNNLVSGGHTTSGFAVTQNGTGKWPVVYIHQPAGGAVISRIDSEGNQVEELVKNRWLEKHCELRGETPSYSVDEYYDLFMSYYNKVKAAEAGADTSAQEAALAKAKAAYEAAKKAESARSNEAKTAKDAVAKAQADLDAAKKATTTAKNTLAQVKAANPTSGLDPDTVARNLEAKRAAYDAAKSALDAAQTRVSTATQTLTQADKRLATATTQANSSAARLTSATQALVSAEASLSQAKDRLSHVTANAQGIKAKADALAAAQAALDAATDVSRARVVGISSTTYDGSAKKQPQAKLVVTVSKGSRSEEYELTQGASGERRVSASYAANVDAGTATVTLSASGTKGSGTFWGSKSATFKIAARKISDAKVDSIPAQTYTGSALKPSVSVTADKVLAVGKDYELSYANNLNAGTARVIITGKGNYAGTRTVDFAIAPKTVGLSWSSSSFTYDGKAHAPKATATGLVGSDTCTVTVSGAKTAAGAYTATATKLSNANYALPSGVTHKFTIAQRAATVTANAATKAYGAKDPALTATVSGLVGSDKLDYSLARKAGEAVGSYAITASGASSQGNYQVTFKGATFTIAAADIAGADVSAIADQTRTGKQLTPKPTVRMGGTTLREGTDYTLAYANNKVAGTATVTITGKGNYTGTARTTFRIVDTATPIPLPPAPDPITPDPSDPTGRFPDVKEGSWYYKVVNRAADLGLIAGYDDGRFGPNDPITRGQVAVILWRLAGMPRAGAGARDFSDVKTGKYYYAAVRWASSVGVVSGYGTSGKFGPEDLVTREQLAVMLSNYARCVARRNATGSAADYARMSDASKVSEYARPALGWAFRNKILTGTNDGRINPQGNATRAEAAKMLVVFYDMLA